MTRQIEFIVYCLKEPRTNEIRYFGKTCQKMARRFAIHLSDKGKSYRTNWVKGLKAREEIPTYEILAIGLDNPTACEIERALIKMGRETGMRLVNLADGGEGPFGVKHTKEFRDRVSLRMRGRKFTEEHKRRIGDVHRGQKRKPLSAEHRLKISLGGKGKLKSATTKQKMSEVFRDRKYHFAKSNFFGLAWHPQNQKWQVRIISPDNRREYLGTFRCEVIAALVYDDAARRHYGESARLNFPNRFNNRV